MNRATILGNGHLLSPGPGPGVVADGAVAWEGERIVAVGGRVEVERRCPGASFLDARGGLVVPGLINLHHHCYSALARGLDPGRPLPAFADVLAGLWWRLDRALDRDSVSLSARLTAAECVRAGCTTVFDHHASPSCLEGSLELLGEAVAEAGISAVLAYEISDRNGHDEALAGLEENLRFCAAHRTGPRLRGMIGLHASFTVDDETLTAVAARRPAGVGCHLHLAEDPLDRAVSRTRYGSAPLDRLLAHDLVDDRALLAHCIDLDEAELAAIAHRGATVVHNPESNANNAVGRLDVARALALGCTVGIGSDGMSSNVLRALRAAFLTHRSGGGDAGAGFELVARLLEANRRFAALYFDEPLLGQFVPGAPADIAVVGAPPPTPLTSDNLVGHLLFGAAEAPVRHTIARGRLLLEDFAFTGLDLERLAVEARALAPALWERFGGVEVRSIR